MMSRDGTLITYLLFIIVYIILFIVSVIVFVIGTVLPGDACAVWRNNIRLFDDHVVTSANHRRLLVVL